MQHILNRIFDEDGGIVQDFDVHIFRDHIFDAGNRLFDPVNHIQGRSIAAFHHDEHDGLLAPHQHGISLRGTRKPDIGNIAHIEGGIADVFDGDVVEILDLHRRGIGLHHPVGRVDFLIAGRQHNVLGRQRIVNIGGREMMGQ